MEFAAYDSARSGWASGANAQSWLERKNDMIRSGVEREAGASRPARDPSAAAHGPSSTASLPENKTLGHHSQTSRSTKHLHHASGVSSSASSSYDDSESASSTETGPRNSFAAAPSIRPVSSASGDKERVLDSSSGESSSLLSAGGGKGSAGLGSDWRRGVVEQRLSGGGRRASPQRDPEAKWQSISKQGRGSERGAGEERGGGRAQMCCSSDSVSAPLGAGGDSSFRRVSTLNGGRGATASSHQQSVELRQTDQTTYAAQAGATCFYFCRWLNISHRYGVWECLLYLMNMFHNHGVDHLTISHVLVLSLCLQERRQRRTLSIMNAWNVYDADVIRLRRFSSVQQRTVASGHCGSCCWWRPKEAGQLVSSLLGTGRGPRGFLSGASSCRVRSTTDFEEDTVLSSQRSTTQDEGGGAAPTPTSRPRRRKRYGDVAPDDSSATHRLQSASDTTTGLLLSSSSSSSSFAAAAALASTTLQPHRRTRWFSAVYDKLLPVSSAWIVPSFLTAPCWTSSLRAGLFSTAASLLAQARSLCAICMSSLPVSAPSTATNCLPPFVTSLLNRPLSALLLTASLARSALSSSRDQDGTRSKQPQQQTLTEEESPAVISPTISPSVPSLPSSSSVREVPSPPSSQQGLAAPPTKLPKPPGVPRVRHSTSRPCPYLPWSSLTDCQLTWTLFVSSWLAFTWLEDKRLPLAHWADILRLVPVDDETARRLDRRGFQQHFIEEIVKFWEDLEYCLLVSEDELSQKYMSILPGFLDIPPPQTPPVPSTVATSSCHASGA